MPKKQQSNQTANYSERRWMTPNKRAKGYAEERKNKVHMFGDKQGQELDDYNKGLRSGYLLCQSDQPVNTVTSKQWKRLTTRNTLASSLVKRVLN